MRKWALAGLILIISWMWPMAVEAQQMQGNPMGKFKRYEWEGVTYFTPTKGFNPDGISNYPYEIYLPDEQDTVNYRIHSNYTRETDACASCHTMHAAVGPALLQWVNVYQTCMACHDGTVTTTYNVVDGMIGSTDTPTKGGMFGNGEEMFLSNHHVVGGVQISAAPGGSVVTRKVMSDQNIEIIQWGAVFGCESCHDPHGQGGNARLLHPDPNGVATAKRSDTGYPASEVETVMGITYYGVKINDEFQYLITGYPYKITVFDLTGENITSRVTIDNMRGFTTIMSDVVVGTVYGTPAVQVIMNITDYLMENEQVEHREGINEFCGACHTDYDTTTVDRPSRNPNGYFSKAYRHAVGVPNTYETSQLLVFQQKEETAEPLITCLTCHFAHGTAGTFWQKTLAGKEGWELESYPELVGSSALKRMPNMGTCEACHQKGRGAQGYAHLSGTVSPQEPGNINGLFSQSTAVYVEEHQGACEKCHVGYEQGFQTTKHGDGLNDDINCQNCHGPAGNHLNVPSVLNIKTFYGRNSKLTVGTCGNAECHQDVADDFRRSKHFEQEKMDCADCHSSHSLNKHNQPLKMLQISLCASCHDRVMLLEEEMPDHSFRETN